MTEEAAAKEEAPQAAKPEAAAPETAKKPTLEEILSKMQADAFENKKAIDLLAQAIVKLNEKIEAQGKGGEGQGGTDFLKILRDLAQGDKSSVDHLVKEAEGFAKLAENLDRFRMRGIGAGEALLMRIGLKAATPRYMTKHEIARMERVLGISNLFAEEGEGEHVRE